MHKSVLCAPLVFALLFAAPLFAQQSYGQNSDYNFVTRNRPGVSDYALPLRWRPLESESESAGTDPSERQRNDASSVYDYTDEPFGLPRGTYRRIEQRHTITPHLEGYRFRPIKPQEQQRNRQRNLSSEQTRQDSSAAATFSTQGGYPSGYQPGQAQPTFKFRPDSRFEGQGHDVPSRYSLPAGDGGARFRPR
jgi:hypothetical protein